MSRSIDLLKHRYLENIKENPELFIGIELEYPVANLEGIATDVEIIGVPVRPRPPVLRLN